MCFFLFFFVFFISVDKIKKVKKSDLLLYWGSQLICALRGLGGHINNGKKKSEEPVNNTLLYINICHNHQYNQAMLSLSFSVFLLTKKYIFF